jgi:hypothetical protein
METKAEEIRKEEIKILTWLKAQNYQTEQGEQEYKMYFDVDMPKIIRKYKNLCLQEAIEVFEKQKEFLKRGNPFSNMQLTEIDTVIELLKSKING